MRDVTNREALTLTIDLAEITAQPRCPARVALYERAGVIDTVLAWSESLVVAGRDDEVETGEFSDGGRFPNAEICELIDRGGLPSGLPVEKQIVLYPAELTSCEGRLVGLVVDRRRGTNRHVNLLVPEASS